MRFLLRSGVPAVLGLLGLVLALPAGGRIEPGARDSSATRPAEAPATIYDSTLHVTWLADADLAATKKFGLPINNDGSMDYSTARAWVRRLDSHDFLGHNDWTLPITPTPYKDAGCSSENKKGGGNFGLGCSTTPLASLYARAFRLKWPDTAVAIPDETTGPFHDFQPYLYWTNAPAKSNGGFRTFSFNTGWSGSNQPDHFMYTLPMLTGNPFGGSATTGLQAVDSDQGVWEPGAGPGDAGITWLADADLSRTQTFKLNDTFGSDGSMEEPTAVDWVQALTTNRWLGQKGWRIPTLQELATLYTALNLNSQDPVVTVPATDVHGFQDIQPYPYWSCAGDSVRRPCHGAPNPNNQQWSFSFGNGFQGTDITPNSLYVIVYYPNSTPTRHPLPPIKRCSPPKPGKPSTCM